MLIGCSALALLAEPSRAEHPDLHLSLKQALEKALSNSSQTTSAAFTAASADAAVRTARSAFLPTVRIDTSAGTIHDRVQQKWETEAPITARDRNSYQAKVILSQGIFSGLRDWRSLRAASFAAESAHWKERQARAETLASVTQRYFALARLQDELAAERQNLTFRERELSDTKARLAAGRATQLQRLQAEYAVVASRPTTLQLEQQLEDERVRFAQSIGIPLDQKFLLTDTLASANATLAQMKIPTLGQLLERALRENPELRAAESLLQKQRNQASQVVGTHLPDLSLDLYAQTDAGRRRDIATEDTNTWGASLKLSIPVFSGMSSFSQYREAAATVRALEEQTRGQRDTIIADLNKARRGWDVSLERVEASTINLETARAKTAEAQSLWRAGRGLYTDLTQAWADEATARRQLAAARFELIASLTTIQKILGDSTLGEDPSSDRSRP
jgi:outer membrane protein TolC